MKVTSLVVVIVLFVGLPAIKHQAAAPPGLAPSPTPRTIDFSAVFVDTLGAAASPTTPGPGPTPGPKSASHTTFAVGDVFVAVGSGKVQWRDPHGNLIKVLDTGLGVGEGPYGKNNTAGMAFDSAGNLYVTNFNARTVSKFDPRGTLIGPFGSGYDGHPESILFDLAGNAYVGQADSKRILKFDAAGKLLKAFDVATEARGSDWLELAADQCTMLYTSEGRSVKRFDVCTDKQLPDFAPLVFPSPPAYALRLLPNGDLMVAATQYLYRLGPVGEIVFRINVPGTHEWFALNLDPDGRSFWTANLGEQRGNPWDTNVYKFDIATGKQLFHFDAAAGTTIALLAGVVIKGEITVVRKPYQVIKEQGRIRIVLPPEVLFEFDRFNLKPIAEAALIQVKGSVIDTYPGHHLIIEGHTDDRGTQAYNLTLSRKRAQSVATWLTQHGINASLLQTVGYGKSRPRYPNTKEEYRALNRRVEIIVVR